MKLTTICLAIIYSLLLTSCSKKLTSIQDLPAGQRTSTYEVLKDVSYGSDAEQNMDIYLSKLANSYGRRNYTIVFLHGGGYYLSDKSLEEKYIEPYLGKGLNVVNLNYRLKRGIPMATSDLTNALNYLKTNISDYNLNLDNVIVTGFSAGAHIATITGLAQNNPGFPYKLNDGITITGIINFAGPVDGLDVIEKIFSDSEIDLWREIGNALFPAEGNESKENIAVYEPITYFDEDDPPVFLWHGGLDNQIPTETFDRFIPMMRKNKDFILYIPGAGHSPDSEQFKDAYAAIFKFLDDL